MADDYKKVLKDKKIEAKKLMTQDQITKCNVIIHTAATAAGAEAAVPIPVVDAVPITATQIGMVIALGKVFGQRISDSAAKAAVGAAAATFVGRSLVKIIPLVGAVISAAVAIGVTEAIGWTIAVDFAKQGVTNISDNNIDTEEPKSTEEHKESSDKDEENEDISVRDKLISDAEEFISGIKNRKECKEEYEKLLTDFDNFLLDVPKGDPLYDVYNKLSDIK